MDNTDKSQKNREKFANSAAWILLIMGVISTQNSIIWAITSDTTDKWFSRLFMAAVCYGFAGIIFKTK